jgi:hypothetical protein
MRTLRFALVLTAVNLGVLSLTLPKALASSAQSVSPVLRTQVLELVDARGRLRSRLNVEPGGEVVLRLFDQNGTIRVKLGAGEHGSGLLLADETTEPGIHLIARRTGTDDRPSTTSLTLRADGRSRILRP